ncbi:UMP kinase [Candidatus Berkelbacteria bacterium RIFCSPHIGHO2_12_FULL_36_9]|uniref:Uridylate kinase n=1 Tax=Candidatus Berkelbacteria bacterium RIFCSPHIGHO2_12_FULL_36_9 TaxID=1797469 RepID=A0A1F5EH60_9BACT|nr:MAG: UMP kinase [Candidatus Berkelbacteria bacterium RIFCSPHIGHO2_12_FULL_36_9]
MQPKYKRILLKLSGEAFLGTRGFGIDLNAADKIAREIKNLYELKVEIAIVVGAENLFRGKEAEKEGMDRATADYTGMIGTIMNALALQSALESHNIPVRVQTAIEMKQVAEPYIRRRAIRHLEKGRVIILSGGTGNPYFSTDTAAGLRALEIGCQVILKATKVDGVYNKDPNKFSKAKKYKSVSYSEALSKKLRVLDSTAMALCRDHDLPIIVFNLFEHGNIKKVVMGEKVGTIVR